MIRIICDSSCDITQINSNKVSFTYAPLTITTSEKSYIDDESLNIKEFVSEIESYKGKSSTACPSIGKWVECFENAEEIIVFCLTSGISGTYNSALSAKSLYLEKHPNCKIHVFDTLTTGAELRLIVEKAIELAEEGNSFDEIIAYITNYKKRTRLFFSLKSLKNFAQNGRVSKLTARLVGVLGIRIFGTASKEGTLQPLSKCRNDNDVINHLLNEMKECDFTGGKVNIGHLNNSDFASRIKDAILKLFPTTIVNIYETRGLCSYYIENGGVLVGIEGKKDYKFVN